MHFWTKLPGTDELLQFRSCYTRGIFFTCNLEIDVIATGRILDDILHVTSSFCNFFSERQELQVTGNVSSQLFTTLWGTLQCVANYSAMQREHSIGCTKQFLIFIVAAFERVNVLQRCGIRCTWDLLRDKCIVSAQKVSCYCSGIPMNELFAFFKVRKIIMMTSHWNKSFDVFVSVIPYRLVANSWNTDWGDKGNKLIYPLTEYGNSANYRPTDIFFFSQLLRKTLKYWNFETTLLFPFTVFSRYSAGTRFISAPVISVLHQFPLKPEKNVLPFLLSAPEPHLTCFVLRQVFSTIYSFKSSKVEFLPQKERST